MQPGFLDHKDRLAKLEKQGVPLPQLERFVGPLLKVIHQKQRKSNAGRKPHDVKMMFKMRVPEGSSGAGASFSSAIRWPNAISPGKTLLQAELAVVHELVALWRRRLSDISWYMRCLNEYIARQLNRRRCLSEAWGRAPQVLSCHRPVMR
jgi:hypothetical protein